MNRFHIVIFLMLFTNISYGQHGNNHSTSRVIEFRASVIKIDITPDNSQNLLGYGARKLTTTHTHSAPEVGKAGLDKFFI